MKKFESLVAEDIKRSLKAFNVDIDDNVARTVALEVLDIICIALREKAKEMERAMSGMQDAASVETVIGMLENG